MQFQANLMGILSNLSAYCQCQPVIDCVYFRNQNICFSAEIRKIDIRVFIPPALKKVGGHIASDLSVRSFVTLSGA